MEGCRNGSRGESRQRFCGNLLVVLLLAESANTGVPHVVDEMDNGIRKTAGLQRDLRAHVGSAQSQLGRAGVEQVSVFRLELIAEARMLLRTLEHAADCKMRANFAGIGERRLDQPVVNVGAVAQLRK